MSAPRAGIVITGTEILSGRVTDRNGPWLADRLEELGIDLAATTIVGDRGEDLLAALTSLASAGVDLIVTSGGLGPTADDLTAEIVGRFQGRELVLDTGLEARIAKILGTIARRWPDVDREAIALGNRKQATVPSGATVLEPVGTAPGLVLAPAGEHPGPLVVVLPGPPRELRAMWQAARRTPSLVAVLARATEYRRGTVRLFGMPESEIAQTVRAAQASIAGLDRLEITTCLRRGEIEVVTRYEPDAATVYDQLVEVIRDRHSDQLFSVDGSTIDDQVASLLRGQSASARRTIATAESCTGGLLVARLTDLPGSSEYVRGGIVAYSNEVKIAQVGVPAELIARHGAVSAEVAQALAQGAISRLSADLGVGITGVAGPGGGSELKPVGLVWLSVADSDGPVLTISVILPGARADIRDRATTVAMHLIRRLLHPPEDEVRSRA